MLENLEVKHLFKKEVRFPLAFWLQIFGYFCGGASMRKALSTLCKVHHFSWQYTFINEFRMMFAAQGVPYWGSLNNMQKRKSVCERTSGLSYPSLSFNYVFLAKYWWDKTTIWWTCNIISIHFCLITSTVCWTSLALMYEKKDRVLQGFHFKLSSGLTCGRKCKLSVLWKSSKLIIQYSDAPQPAKMTGLTSYRQGWLWSLNPLSGYYTSLSLIRLTDPGKNLYRIC